MPKKGYKPTEEHKRKNSESQKGRKLSEEHKEKLRKNASMFWLGKHLPREMREKIANGHRGKPLLEEHRLKVIKTLSSYGDQTSEKNPMWKGDEIGYQGIHAWIRRNLGHSQKCEHCSLIGEKIGHHWNIDWANISKQYKRDKKDWIGLCRKCHRKFDKK